MKTTFVYVLRSQVKDILYVGLTQNIERRIKEHNDGKSTFTSAYIPWQLIYFETLPDTNSARKREKYLKSAAGKKFLKKTIQP